MAPHTIVWQDARPQKGGSRAEQPAAYVATFGKLVVRIGLDYAKHETDWVIEAPPFFRVDRPVHATVIGKAGTRLEDVQTLAAALVRDALEMSLSQL